MTKKKPQTLIYCDIKERNLFGRWTQGGHFETIVDILMHENSIKMR